MRTKTTLIAVILFFCNNVLTAKRIALLIGVGQYPVSSKWQQLHAQNDVQLLAKTLAQRGFEPQNILQLSDENATKIGIQSASNKLISQVEKGDMVYFHFSGHGQQVKDNNNDEIDGYDEAIVPFDSPKHYQSGIYEGKNLLIDDELNVFFMQIRKKIGTLGQLFISIDACHSGTGIRGFKVARGTDEKMADAAYQQLWANKNSEAATLDNATENNDDVAPYICFFSSGAHQLSYEHNTKEGTYGLLTYFLSQSILSTKEVLTYKLMFEQIKNRFIENNALQTPEIEGKYKLTFLNESALKSDNTIPITAWLQSKALKINAGTLIGLTEGSTVSVFNADHHEFCKATLEDLSAFDATVLLPKPIDKKDAIGAYLKVLTIRYDPELVRIKSDKTIQQNIAQSAPIQWVDENYDLSLVYNQQHLLRCFSADNNLFMEQTKGEDINVMMQQICTKWYKSKTLRSLNLENETLKGSLRFKDDKGNYIEKTISTGKKIRLEIKNDGTEPFYFSILDLSPNFEMNVILPFERPASEYFLKSGQTYISDFELQVSEPLGYELFKLIATPQPLDLTNLSIGQTRGVHKGNNGLEQLLNPTFILGSKGVNNIQLDTDDVMIQSFSLEIVK